MHLSKRGAVELCAERGKKMKRFLVLLSVVLVFTVMCSAAEPVIIRMHGGYDQRTDGSIGPYEILDTYLRQYEALNPGVKVENLGRELDVDKLINLYIVGQMADVIEIDVKFLASFYELGMLAEVPKPLHEQTKQSMFPASVEFITVDGRMAGIPGENMVTGLWYSRRAMAEGGVVNTPKTAGELETLGKRLARVSSDGIVERHGFIHTGAPWSLNHMALAMLTAEGGRVYDEKGSIAIDSPALRSTVNRLLEWLGGTTPWFARDDVKPQFDRGEIAFGFGYPWWVSGIQTLYQGDLMENFGVALFPGGQTYGAFHYGHGYGVNAQSKHQEEVWKLLEWLSLNRVKDTTPIGHMMANLGSLPNVRRDIASEHYAPRRALYEGFIANLDYAANLPVWERAAIGEAVLDVIDGITHPEEAIRNVVNEVEVETRKHEEWLKSRR